VWRRNVRMNYIAYAMWQAYNSYVYICGYSCAPSTFFSCGDAERWHSGNVNVMCVSRWIPAVRSPTDTITPSVYSSVLGLVTWRIYSSSRAINQHSCLSLTHVFAAKLTHVFRWYFTHRCILTHQVTRASTTGWWRFIRRHHPVVEAE